MFTKWLSNKKTRRTVYVVYIGSVLLAEFIIINPLQRISLTPKRIHTPELELLSEAQGRDYYIEYVPNESKLLYVAIRMILSLHAAYLSISILKQIMFTKSNLPNNEVSKI